MTGSLLAIRNLAVRYPTPAGTVTAVDNVSLSLGAGATLGIVGESGSGKSTLALAMIGLLADAARVEGSIAVDGTEVVRAPGAVINRIRGKTVGLVYQDSLAALNPVRPVGVQIAEVMRRHLGLDAKAAREGAIDALARVGIPNPSVRVRQYPHEFSGGMRQRVAIAMAIAGRPKLVIADEPTTALDVTVQAQVLRLLRDLREEHGMALVIVSHDLEVIREATETMAVMYDGRLVEFGPTAGSLAAPRHPYTRALLDSAPSIDRPIISFIPGMPPRAGETIVGCSFAARCDVAQGREVCHLRRPAPAGDAEAWAACHFPLVAGQRSARSPDADAASPHPSSHQLSRSPS
jgi:oligopeptide/dipeptide ABC transporter ATP-binding protein